MIAEQTFQLTDSQKVLKVKLAKFLKSPDRIFRLIGKPGVGKTTMSKITLAKYIKADIDSQSTGMNINVAGISMSHQAKKVLGEHIPNVFTFAKAFGMKEVIDEFTGARDFQIDPHHKDLVIGRCNIPIFIHDEVSQYTSKMLEIVLNNTPIFSKIILMGDKAQLPPIDANNEMKVDEDSPVFDLELPDTCQHELTERVRQAKGNPILDLTDIIREEIFGSQNIGRILDLLREPKMINGLGYDFIKYNQIIDHMEGRNHLDAVLIAFRNKCINFFNDLIREKMLKSPIDAIVVGDVIRMTDNFYTADSNGRMQCVFNNSDAFEIKQVFSSKVKVFVGGRTYYIDCFRALTSEGLNKEFICPTTNGMVDFTNALNEIATLCKKRELKWDEFWKFKEEFCKYSYAYAITAYKAQGSTYETVYVDINDILSTRPLTPKRKLQTIYTAITRAKKDVYFLKK